MASICVKMDVHYTYCQGDYFYAQCFYLRNAILSLSKLLISLCHVPQNKQYMSTQHMETVTGHASVLHVCVCLCLRDVCSASRRVEPAKRRATAVSPSLGRDRRSPGTGLGSTSRAEGSWAGVAGGGSHASDIT